jgi:hypothetical protein
MSLLQWPCPTLTGIPMLESRTEQSTPGHGKDHRLPLPSRGQAHGPPQLLESLPGQGWVPQHLLVTPCLSLLCWSQGRWGRAVGVGVGGCICFDWLGSQLLSAPALGLCALLEQLPEAVPWGPLPLQLVCLFLDACPFYFFCASTPSQVWTLHLYFTIPYLAHTCACMLAHVFMFTQNLRRKLRVLLTRSTQSWEDSFLLREAAATGRKGDPTAFLQPFPPAWVGALFFLQWQPHLFSPAVHHALPSSVMQL